MNKVEKGFPVQMLNTDDAPHVIPDGSAVNLRNIRVHASVDGKAGYYENILQNIKVSGQDGKIPAGSERVASWEDPAGRFAIWFTHVANSPDLDQINLYDFSAGKYWLVAKANMGVNGEISGGLGFRYGNFYDLQYINGMLYWTGPDHQPRKIHVGAGIKACDPGAVQDSPFYSGWRYDWVNSGDDDTSNKNLSLAVKPPGYPPMISKRSDPLVGANNLTGESFSFSTQFVFQTMEESTLSMFSENSMVNSDEERGKNVIDVSINPLELPFPQGLKQIRLYVKKESSEEAFLIKTWEYSEISGSSILSYAFYGNYYGVAIAKSVWNEQFHSVPRRAKTMELIGYRLMLGNCLEGYNTPAKTSMRLELGAPVMVSALNNQIVKVHEVMYRGLHKIGAWWQPRFYYSGLYVKLDSVPQPGYYLIPGTEIRWNSGFSGIPPVFSAVPASIPIGSLVFKGTSISEIIENTRSWTIAKIYESFVRETVKTIPVVGLLASGSPRVTAAFLHSADQTAGVAFYDRWLQKCGVVTNDGIRVSVPKRDFLLTTGYPDIKYSFDNSDAVNEIPEWAEYYAPLLSRNSRAMSLVSGTSSVTRYARINQEDLSYKYDDGLEDSESGNDDAIYLEYSDAAAGIGIDSTSLVNSALGYSYNTGDICILISEDNTVHYLPVTGQDGKFIRLAAKNIGSLSGKKFAYEIYKPYKGDAQDFYFEVGQMYPVVEPGTDNRKYSVLSGSFKPDTYIIERRNGFDTSYRAFAMCPNDLYWQRWDTHFGRINKVLNIGESQKTGNISYGDTFSPGTTFNNLSSFHATNETNNIPSAIGPIVKLQRASKSQGNGDVLVAICEAGAASVYIGESQIFDQSGNAILAKSDRVIGQINPLDTELGTIHPESVRAKDGQIFWYSHQKKSFARYASNGVFPISMYKFQIATNKLAAKIDSHINDGDLVMINAGIDPEFNEYLVQKKVYAKENFGKCEKPINVVVAYAPTVPNPERVLVSWDNSGSDGVFMWTLFDTLGFPVSSDSNFIPGTPIAQVELIGLIQGVPYSFDVSRKCGSGNVSPAVRKVVYLSGITPPPGGDCVKPTHNGEILPFLGKVGTHFHAEIEINGTIPFSISTIVKPGWASLTLTGRTVVIDGIPGVGDQGAAIPISFTITNCSPDVLNYVNEITIAL